MILSPGEWISLLVLGGVVALDGTSVGQTMVSRPVVAATLAGWIVGAPAEGAMVGLLLEAFHLSVLPVGAARYPEGGPPAVAAGAVYAALSGDAVLLLPIVAVTLLVERAAGRSVQWLRLLNGRLIPPADAASLSPRTLEVRHLQAIGADFLRGVIIVAAGLLLLAGVGALPEALHPRAGVSRLAIGAVLVAALAASLRIFAGEHRRVFFAGALLGTLLFSLRG